MLEDAVWSSPARVDSFDAVRETKTMLKPERASWRAYCLPMPSPAPVMTAHEPFGPNDRSCDIHQLMHHTSREAHTDVPGKTKTLRRTLMAE